MKVDLYSDTVACEFGHILSWLDRNSASGTYGCFDRRYWSWRIGDMPNASLQYGLYPLSLAWKYSRASAYKKNTNLLEWIEAAIRFTIRIQNKNGSFDQFFPKEQSVGTTYYLLSAMINARELLADSINAELLSQFDDTISLSSDFISKHDEQYAIISNHIALFAYVNLKLGRLRNDRGFESRALEQLKLIFHHQSNEGWFLEYNGADPGYQTQCIYYLAECFRITGDERILDRIRKSIEEFLLYFFHPDGSFGGVYGSRNTEIIYPAGFEMIRDRIPCCGDISGFIHEGIRKKTIVMPDSLDDENLIRLSTNYMVAALYAGASKPCKRDKQQMPFEKKVDKCFSEAGLRVRSNERYYSIVNFRKGGVYKVFDKKKKILIGEDSGYFFATSRGVLTNQMLDDSETIMDDAGISLKSFFYRTLDEVPTPLITVAIRILSLTFFRFLAMVDLFRLLLVRKAFTGKKKYGICLERKVSYHDKGIVVKDEIRKDARMRVDRQLRGRKAFSVKMASSNYHVAGDLVEIRQPIVDIDRLNAMNHVSMRYEIMVS
ncbi:MAG: hypothetical protein A2W19_05430 [Spirochaetes bacterium RBG_16_49_21]|nr:MAG: hypothetical protein A2W19_05430 [Spirochaetes bacterium RBG_16_49_21]